LSALKEVLQNVRSAKNVACWKVNMIIKCVIIIITLQLTTTK